MSVVKRHHRHAAATVARSDSAGGGAVRHQPRTVARGAAHGATRRSAAGRSAQCIPCRRLRQLCNKKGTERVLIAHRQRACPRKQRCRCRHECHHWRRHGCGGAACSTVDGHPRPRSMAHARRSQAGAECMLVLRRSSAAHWRVRRRRSAGGWIIAARGTAARCAIYQRMTRCGAPCESPAVCPAEHQPLRHPVLTTRLDAAAKRKGRTAGAVLAIGTSAAGATA